MQPQTRLLQSTPLIKRKCSDSARLACWSPTGGSQASQRITTLLDTSCAFSFFLFFAAAPSTAGIIRQSASSAEGSESVESSWLSDVLPRDEHRRRPFRLSCVRCRHDKLMLMRTASVRHPGGPPAPLFPAFDKTLSDGGFYRAAERRTKAGDYILRR